MDVLRRILVALAPLAIVTQIGCGANPGPATPVTTVWNKIGIPQAFQRGYDNVANKFGNFPGLERKPPLLRIADPANLESPWEPVKVAAEVKMAEDAKQQKIKALKYLGEIGCGCYDKDGKIEAALLAALEDCTPDVRIAAAEAIQEAVGECACVDTCAQTCCTEKIQEKLAELAYGEKDGCYIEPNAEVREAALAALSACPPILEEVPVQNGGGGGETIPTVPGEGVPTQPMDESTSIINGDIPQVTSDASYYTPSQSAVPITSNPQFEDDYDVDSAVAALVPSVHVQPEFAAAEATQQEAMIPAMIESIDSASGQAQVAFFDSYEIPVGAQMVIVNEGSEIAVDVIGTTTGQVTVGTSSSVDYLDAELHVGQMVKVGILAD